LVWPNCQINIQLQCQYKQCPWNLSRNHTSWHTFQKEGANAQLKPYKRLFVAPCTCSWEAPYPTPHTRRVCVCVCVCVPCDGVLCESLVQFLSGERAHAPSQPPVPADLPGYKQRATRKSKKESCIKLKLNTRLIQQKHQDPFIVAVPNFTSSSTGGMGKLSLLG